METLGTGRGPPVIPAAQFLLNIHRPTNMLRRNDEPHSRRNINGQATNLKLNCKKCKMNPLKNTALISKRKITVFGNL